MREHHHDQEGVEGARELAWATGFAAAVATGLAQLTAAAVESAALARAPIAEEMTLDTSGDDSTHTEVPRCPDVRTISMR